MTIREWRKKDQRMGLKKAREWARLGAKELPVVVVKCVKPKR